jgi:TRAP-type C4-dicarboxylate transport system permease small subunit
MREKLRKVLQFVAGAAYVVFIAASMGWFVCNVIDAALNNNAARAAEDIVLFLAGLITAATIDALKGDDE